jgi:hypothetical protein
VLCLKEPGEETIPRDHRLDVSAVTRQTLGVFSHITRTVTFFFIYLGFHRLVTPLMPEIHLNKKY